jgi:hypothetical protein
MEICTMDKPTSHFYKGIGPNERSSLNGFEAVGDDEDNYSVPYISSNHHPPPLQQPTCSVNNVQYQEDWKNDGFECKQESEAMPLENYLDDHSSFGPPENYNDTFNYDYSSSSSSTNTNNKSQSLSFFSNDVPSQRNHSLYRNSSNNSSGSGNPATYSPYQISASTKSQLPAWYNPPQPSLHHQHQHSFAPPPPPPPHPSYYQQPSANFYPYQANYNMASSIPTSSDQNMRNMIQMTNRYSTFISFITACFLMQQQFSLILIAPSLSVRLFFS